MKGANIVLNIRFVRSHKFVRPQICNYFAFAQQHGAIGKIKGLIQIMRYHQHRLAQPSKQLAQHILHLRSSQRVKRAERLIHQQNPGLRSQRARQSHALPLPSRQLMRIPPGKTGWVQPYCREQLAAPPHTLFTRPAFCLKHQPHIALHCEMRKQARLLNHVANAPAQRDQILIANALAAHQHFTARRLQHAVHRTQQRGLSRPAAPKDRRRGPFFERNRNIVEQQPSLRSRKGKIPKFDRCAHTWFTQCTGNSQIPTPDSIAFSRRSIPNEALKHPNKQLTLAA